MSPHDRTRRFALVLTLVGTAVLGIALSAQHARFLFSRNFEAYHDWDQHLFYADVAVRAVRHFGQAPFWNPFPCGGTPLLAAPESRIYTPMFLLHLLFGARTALRLEVVLHLLLAAFGAAWLVREHLAEETSPVVAAAASVGAAAVFAGSTVFVLHLAEGHAWILAAAYLPWVMLFFERGLARPLYAALAGAVIALMIGEGGIYPVPQIVLLLGLYAVALALSRRSVRPLGTLALTGLTALLLGAPKLLPLAVLMRQHPRLVDSTEHLPFKAVLAALIGRDQQLGRSFPWTYWPWHEQGAYVGALAVGLAGVGAFVSRARNRILAALAVLAAALAAGHFAAYAPWSLLHRVPPFRSQHVPSRFFLLDVLLVACLAGEGIRWLLSKLSLRARPWAAVGLVLLVAGDLMSVRAGVLGPIRCVAQPWPEKVERGHPFLTRRAAPVRAYCLPTAAAPNPRDARYSAMAPAVDAGVALLDAYEPLCPRARGLVGRDPGLFGKGEPGYRGEAWVERGAGTVRIVSRTQQSLVLEADAEPGALVLVNQNWDPGWHVSKGAHLVDSDARLGVQLDAGKGRYRLWYFPPFLGLGLLLALLGAVIIGKLALDERIKPS